MNQEVTSIKSTRFNHRSPHPKEHLLTGRNQTAAKVSPMRWEWVIGTHQWMYSPVLSVVSYNWISYDRLVVVNEVLRRFSLQKKLNVNIYAVYWRSWYLTRNNERKIGEEGKSEVKEGNERLSKKVAQKKRKKHGRIEWIEINKKGSQEK